MLDVVSGSSPSEIETGLDSPFDWASNTHAPCPPFLNDLPGVLGCLLLGCTRPFLSELPWLCPSAQTPADSAGEEGGAPCSPLGSVPVWSAVSRATAWHSSSGDYAAVSIFGVT